MLCDKHQILRANLTRNVFADCEENEYFDLEREG